MTGGNLMQMCYDAGASAPQRQCASHILRSFVWQFIRRVDTEFAAYGDFAGRDARKSSLPKSGVKT